MRKTIVAAVAVIALAACSKQNQTRVSAPAPASATVSGAKAKSVMHERSDGMKKVGKAMKILGAQIKSGTPDMTAVKTAAAAMDGLARKSSTWFPAGTGPDAGKTRAKAEIWLKPQDFAAKVKGFQTAAANFNAAAQTGNAATATASLGELGKSCKACHDNYRSDEHR